jgi:hypothetical protein
MKHALTVVALASLLAGCVVGQSLPSGYEAGPAAATANGTSVAVAVHDERPFVKSGDKPPYYIGKYRGGFGNPFDVTTRDDEPLASLLQRDVGKDLQALGYAVVSGPGAQRKLDVAIVDWNFDGLMNGKFWYELDARVLGPDGAVLATSLVKDSQYVEGSVWVGAKAGFEAKMPGLYAGAIHKLIRENATISGALGGAPPPQ